MADDNSARYRSNDPFGRGPAQAAPASDPLAELARLIGRSDPFAECAREAVAAQPPPAGRQRATQASRAVVASAARRRSIRASRRRSIREPAPQHQPSRRRSTAIRRRSTAEPAPQHTAIRPPQLCSADPTRPATADPTLAATRLSTGPARRRLRRIRRAIRSCRRRSIAPAHAPHRATGLRQPELREPALCRYARPAGDRAAISADRAAIGAAGFRGSAGRGRLCAAALSARAGSRRHAAAA